MTKTRIETSIVIANVHHFDRQELERMEGETFEYSQLKDHPILSHYDTLVMGLSEFTTYCNSEEFCPDHNWIAYINVKF